MTLEEYNKKCEDILKDNSKEVAAAINYFDAMEKRKQDRGYAYEKSLEYSKEEYKPKKKKCPTFGKIVIATGLVLSTLVGAHEVVKSSAKVGSRIPAGNIINEEIDNAGVKEFYTSYIDEHSGSGKVSEKLHYNLDIVARHTYRSTTEDSFWYDYDGIAEEITKSDINPHINLYASYYHFEYGKEKHMDNLLSRLSTLSSEDSYFSDIKSFEEYLAKLNITNTNDYDNIMKHLINLYFSPEKNEEYENLLARLTFAEANKEISFKNQERVGK